MRQLLTLPAVSLFLAFGCFPAPDNLSQEVDLEAERMALMEADRAMFEAYSTSDSPVDALMAHFLDDANVLPPDAPLARGKEESRGVFAALESMCCARAASRSRRRLARARQTAIRWRSACARSSTMPTR